jgi:hypothetical protein
MDADEPYLSSVAVEVERPLWFVRQQEVLIEFNS